jgi:tetratricopeptide (TPR) repeat protein
VGAGVWNHFPVHAGEPEGRDFFVSYTQADRAWAEWIAEELERAGYRVLLQAWDAVPGTNWVEMMQAGVRDAARMIAVLSEAYLESAYANAEWQATWATDPDGRERKLLPVRVEDCDRPGLLAGVVSFDLFGLDEAGARQQLLAEVRAAVAGRVGPPVPSPFPGTGRAPFPGGVPRAWGVPRRDPNFTGRGDELADLARRLACKGTVTVHGMGGVGKTALAAEYAYVHSAEYDVAWWVAAEQPASLPDKFADLAARLGAEPADGQEALQAQVRDLLAAVTGWLLIFDNADAAADILPWLPAEPRSADRPGHVIVSTRRGGFGELGQVLELDVIEPADAVALMRTRAPDLEQDTAEHIAKELGRLPLALEQAGAYLDRTRAPGEEYLELLRSGAADLEPAGSHAKTVATLSDISLERVAADSPEAIQLLEVCAYLAPEPVPLDLFTAHPGLLPEPLSKTAGDRVAFNDTIAVLVDYSLAKRSRAGLQMHRRVQAAARARRDPSLLTGAPAGKKTRMGAARERTETEWHPLAAALLLLRVHAPAEIIGHPRGWPRWERLLPHVLAAAEHVERLLSHMLAAAEHVDPAQAPGSELMRDASWLLDRAGTYQQVHARLGAADSLMLRALDIAKVSLGPGHPDVAARQNNRAAILRDLGLPGKARPLLEQAMATTEAAYGPGHPYVAVSLSNLAMTLRDLGQQREARPLLEQAVAITEAAYGPGHADVAAGLSNLATVLRDLGQLDEAQRRLEQAVPIAEAACGPDHPAVAIPVGNLAAVLRDLGRAEEARPLAERALAIDEAAYGPRHPIVAIRLDGLAAVLRDLGRAEEARPLAERAAAIRRKGMIRFAVQRPSKGRRNVSLAVGHDRPMTSNFDSSPEDEYADDEYADHDAEDREQPSTSAGIPDDEPEADVLEQRQEVPYDQDEDG